MGRDELASSSSKLHWLDVVAIVALLCCYLSTYFFIASVRVKFQLLASVIPSFLSIVGIAVFFFLLPFISFDDGEIWLKHIPWDIPNERNRLLFQMAEFVAAFIAFTIAVRHVWIDR